METDHRDTARARILEIAVDDGVIPVVTAHEDTVATDLIEKAGVDLDVLGVVHQHRTGAGDGPVSLQQELVGFAEERTVRTREGEALESEVLNRSRRRCPDHIEKLVLRRKLDGCAGEVGSRGRPEIELPRRFLVVPLASSVQLLENVLDHAVVRVHSLAPVVVAYPLIGHRRAALPGDDEIVATPLRIVLGADVTRPFGRIGPFADAAGVDAVRRVAVEYLGGVVIRIPGEYLAFAVQE